MIDRHALSCSLAFAAACLAGCGPAAAPPPPAAVQDRAGGHDHGHDHSDHSHPVTLAAGIAELETLVADIAAKFAGGEASAADDAVHGVGHLLDDIQGLLKDSSLSANARAAAAGAVDELYECFDEVDTALHAAPGKADPPAEVHARLQDRIKTAMKSLKESGR